jgi:hypothetical protein
MRQGTERLEGFVKSVKPSSCLLGLFGLDELVDAVEILRGACGTLTRYVMFAAHLLNDFV